VEEDARLIAYQRILNIQEQIIDLSTVCLKAGLEREHERTIHNLQLLLEGLIRQVK
jgi:hypothetical protein